MTDVGLLGGTFDPIHVGHLCMAEWVASAFDLDKIYFIPAGQPPHKADRPVRDKYHRLNMVKAAVADEPLFEVLTLEIEKPAPSLTIETLRALDGRWPERPYFIIGLDSLLTLPTWHNYLEFSQYCRLAVLPRVHDGLTTRAAVDAWVKEHLPTLQDSIFFVEMPAVDISSTVLRERLHQGQRCRYFFPTGVWDYIQKEQLYR